MADVPDELVHKVARDREGKRDVAFRRIAVSILLVFLTLGLLNLFGQHPSATTAEAATASLEVHAPERVRSGLYYQARSLQLDPARRPR